jgi:arginyl-tRNA synthetase
MSLLDRLSDEFGAAFEKLGLDPELGRVVVSQRPELGQFQVNGAMAAGRQAGRPPRQVAQAVIKQIRATDRFATLEVAGPGFINITLTDEALADHIRELVGDDRQGVAPVERPLTVVLDFAGPNVAKPMHVGHLRATIIGDSLRRLFGFAGHRAIGDPHFGDWGLQMGQLITELEQRRPELPYFDPDSTGPYPEEPPLTLDDLIELYPEAVRRSSTDPAAMAAAQRATTDLQRGRPGYLALWRHFVAVSRASQEADFDRLGVHFDLWMGESDVERRIPEMLERVRASGAAEDSEGALIVRVDRPDDRMEIPPLLLVTSRGSYLYSTTDLATIDQRVQELGAAAILYVVDARQSLHFEQVFRAAQRTGIASEDVDLEHIAFGTMNGPDGRPFKTREGGVVRLSDLIEMVTAAALDRIDEADIAAGYPEEERRQIATAVGLAALKFGDLSNHRMSNYVFDLDRFASFEGKTGPYLLYGAVRIKSILRRAEELGLSAGTILPPVHPAERQLMLTVALFPEAVDRAIEGRAPNHVAEYAYGLATDFNRFYDVCHILRQEDKERQASWLTLVTMTLATLVRSLELLGIGVPDRM